MDDEAVRRTKTRTTTTEENQQALHTLPNTNIAAEKGGLNPSY
jgi:hypothetical protein